MMDRSDSFIYKKGFTTSAKTSGSSSITSDAYSEVACSVSPSDSIYSDPKQGVQGNHETEEKPAPSGMRRGMEGRVIRGNKAPDIPIFERKNWLIHLHYIRKDFEACKVLAKELLEESDEMCEYALYILGLVTRHEGDLQASLELFQKAVHLDPTNPTNVKQVARSQFLLGKHKIAMDTYAEASLLSPNDWEVLHNQGVCSAYLKQYDKAVDFFQTALEQSSQTVTFKQLGKVYLLTNSIHDALSVYKRAIKWSPEDPDLLTTFGLLHLQLGNSPQAFEALGSALTFDPTHAPAVLAVGCMMQEHGDFDVALSKYRVASQKLPESPQLWNNIGMCNFGRKRYVAAINCLKRATYLDPLEWRVLYNLGLLHLSTQRYASAFHFLRAATSFKPKSGLVYMLLAITLTRLEDSENADLMYNEALKFDKDAPIINLNYAIFLYNMEVVAGAAKQLAIYNAYVHSHNSADLDTEMIEVGKKLMQMPGLMPNNGSSPEDSHQGLTQQSISYRGDMGEKQET